MKPMSMNKEILEKLKKKLEERQAKIEKELAAIAEKDEKVKGDYDTRFPDFGTHQSTDESALEVAAYENALPLEYAMELRLADINKALEKIAQGAYGQCEKCGQAIGEKRLEAMPEAKLCIQCQK
ncbi:MAG: TraR/DksA family transcriptional regulator [Parcubacteria group bacterium LiPW_39]|nr:MAG: TraR/DksA family transcriptional regulator [Parcubacteria group bacterium LiPW_39]